MNEGAAKPRAMPPASTYSQRVAQSVERAANIFTDKKMRFTTLRQQVFAEIAATHGAVGAYEVLERLATKGTRLAPISVYRALDALMEAGVVHRLESKNAFFACRIMHGKGRRQLVMSCEQCGNVDEVDGDIIFETIDKVARKAGFEPRVKFVELSGLCANCAEKK